MNSIVRNYRGLAEAAVLLAQAKQIEVDAYKRLHAHFTQIADVLEGPRPAPLPPLPTVPRVLDTDFSDGPGDGG